METMTGVDVQMLRGFVRDYEQLRKISQQLHRADEAACNYGLSPRQEQRVARLEAQAQTIADRYGLTAYHQSDPRGWALYLITAEMNETNYHNGIGITPHK